ncbi:hypothetical protein M9H77_30732 [Catharanthus roseus]|uniref:Uncharacterized protein n=1 Tax=Catharanthus roseus TaxID=4058 RepID=A0ACB9ZY22_CATRO|nr:hypothetical protein M9H77_30732 [Catharanthus roseus]
MTKCGCPFKLKGEQMATSENWQLLVHNGRHNHKIAFYSHSHAQSARLTEEQLQQTKQFRKSHVPPCNILRFFREQDVGCAVRVWISQVLHFGVETTNRAESEHSVLKLWLSMCHGDLYTVFLNIDSLIQAQIAEIKYSLEISRLKKKYGAKKEDVVIFWRKLEISSDIPEEHHRDIESKMRDLTSLLHEISTGPSSNFQEVRRLNKGVIHSVLPDDPCQPLSTPPETAVTKG